MGIKYPSPISKYNLRLTEVISKLDLNSVLPLLKNACEIPHPEDRDLQKIFFDLESPLNKP